eukprot:Plantae.Rhodophyta-Hildenbrandia_rubra.ctg10651.p2 GENE.Plantae.Rhodophyta-Hildenbrandia_rubra.ctg10651~~Plantae.Rhodophyta-Hildenbrandia_rubra.ctg10651.p2  ORF type:complete len:354 (+),score=94.10 Plantae.Rhodophyta-Hildenbrandia_rubra.ctg10651:130-1191(+)
MVWGFSLWGGRKNSGGDVETSQASDSVSGDSLRSGAGRSSTKVGGEGAEALSAKDVVPVEVTREKLSTRVPLLSKGMPETLVEARPGLRLTEYDLERGMFCANVLSLCHNAVRREVVDWEVDVIAGMERIVERESGENNPCGMEVVSVAGKLGMWWAGFARLILCVSLVEDMVVKKAFEDVYVGFGKETREMEKNFRKCVEKNNVYLETAIRRVDRAMKTLEDVQEDDDIREMVQECKRTWNAFITMLLDLYTSSEDLIKSIDKFVREPIEYEELEQGSARIFITKKKWGEDSEKKRGELLVMLTRWMGDEMFMRRWASANLSKKEAKKFEIWMNDYRAGRLALVDSFHQLRL